jgi:spore coat protein H
MNRAVAHLLFLLTWVPALLARAEETRFPVPAVWPIQIEVSPQNAASLQARPREYVRATVRILETSVDAAVRLKGRGTFQSLEGKPSFTIDFDRFTAGQRVPGLEKIHLNNSLEDPSYLKELIGSEAFQAAGIPAPRVGHALVTLNGKLLGLYVLKEGFTDEFLKRHFGKATGNLYDTDEGSDIDKKMELELGASSGQDELKRLAAAALEPDLARRWERLDASLDADRFLTFLAVEMMICHWDGYALSKNNFRIYYDADRDKVVFLPAGMDQIFSKADLTWKPNMLGLVARSMLETREGAKNYESKFRKMFEHVFDTARFTNRISKVVAELRPFLSAQEFANIDAEAKNLSASIAQRETSLREQLLQKEPQFPQFVNGVAPLAGWKPFDPPAGGEMADRNSSFMIKAGPKTAASWRTTVRLKPGRYIFAGSVKTKDVVALPFGARQGASLRVIGDTAQSRPLLGSNEATLLRCEFEVQTETDVTLACELRVSQGEAEFENGLTLERVR